MVGERTERPEVPQVSVMGPVLSTGLNSLQMVCARELAKGRDAREVRKQFAVHASTWKKWLKDPRFIAAVESRVDRADQLVLAALADGEALAAQTLVEALSATKPIRHKDGKIRQHPDWDARTRAAISLLDRRGERGKPVERRVQGNLNVNASEVRNELVGALADPTVRQFLEQNPAIADRLRLELLGGPRSLPPAEPPAAPPPEPAPSGPVPIDATPAGGPDSEGIRLPE